MKFKFHYIITVVKMSYYRLRLEELVALQDGWCDGKGIAPSLQALAVMKILLIDYLEAGLRFGITPQLNGSIELKTNFFDYINPKIERSITCIIREDGSLHLRLVGIPRRRDESITYKPHELSECAQLLNYIRY